jgi:hypothetical protein
MPYPLNATKNSIHYGVAVHVESKIQSRKITPWVSLKHKDVGTIALVSAFDELRNHVELAIGRMWSIGRHNRRNLKVNTIPSALNCGNCFLKIKLRDDVGVRL